MGPVKKLNCLNDSGPTKLVKVLTYIQTKTSLVGLVKKLNCLNDTKTSFLGLFELFIFYKKILHAPKALKVLKAQKHNQAKAQNANKRVSNFFPLKCFLCTFLFAVSGFVLFCTCEVFL